LATDLLRQKTRPSKNLQGPPRWAQTTISAEEIIQAIERQRKERWEHFRARQLGRSAVIVAAFSNYMRMPNLRRSESNSR
jgi:hypothetical protein